MKSLGETASSTIGIKLWLAPQISEHCPYNKPGRRQYILNWLSRPGIASTLIPNDGIVHEWITSAADTRRRICVLNGITVRLSTSRSRRSISLISCEGIIYESNSTWGKSEYS